jgi:hypothetical protein
MKRFAFTAALAVFATTVAFADTLPDQVRSEASRLLRQVDAAKAVATARPALKPQPLAPVLVTDLQHFGMSASRLSLDIDKAGGPVDLRCIFRGMAEETDNQLKAANAATTGDQQAKALSRLSHMLKDAVEIAPAAGGAHAQTKAAAKTAATTCPAVREF